MIDFLVYALNNIDIASRDIHNAYLNSYTKYKIFFCAGNKWEYDQEKVVVIVRDLYGLTSSTLAWINHLAKAIGNYMGFAPSFAYTIICFKESKEKNSN